MKILQSKSCMPGAERLLDLELSRDQEDVFVLRYAVLRNSRRHEGFPSPQNFNFRGLDRIIGGFFEYCELRIQFEQLLQVSRLMFCGLKIQFDIRRLSRGGHLKPNGILFTKAPDPID
jgi:hypothetical protein